MAKGVEDMFVLRLPLDCAQRVREAIKSDSIGERLQLEFYGDMRHAHVRFDDEVTSGVLVDLPCVVEAHKTLDKKTAYKTADISQMLVCGGGEEGEAPGTMEDLPLAKRRELLRKFMWQHGMTPPLKNVRKRRFRKTAVKKIVDSPEIEKEVRRLLREDYSAVSVSYKVVTDEDRQDDVQSLLSEADTSLSQVQSSGGRGSGGVGSSGGGGGEEEGDSLACSPLTSSPAPGDDRQELLRILQEASSSSEGEGEGEGEGEDEEEEEEMEESISDEVLELREATQDLEAQIEEQKLKIQNTPNPLLRERFETFLGELERQKGAKEDQLRRLQS